MANSCKISDIDYYLQRGFSHEQVVQLCSSSSVASVPPVTQQQSTSAHVASTLPPSIKNTNNRGVLTNPQNNINNNTAEQLYFATVLNATSAKINPTSLSYTSKECVEYGEVNITGMKDKVCADTRITIQLNGLQILRANKGVFLLREQELLVRGNIQREYLNINSFSSSKKVELRSQLPTNPSQLNLPVRKGIDPKQVATRLKKFI